MVVPISVQTTVLSVTVPPAVVVQPFVVAVPVPVDDSFAPVWEKVNVVPLGTVVMEKIPLNEVVPPAVPAMRTLVPK